LGEGGSGKCVFGGKGGLCLGGRTREFDRFVTVKREGGEKKQKGGGRDQTYTRTGRRKKQGEKYAKQAVPERKGARVGGIVSEERCK